MRNILMTLCYIGTAYHGSQVQSNALSVTEVVQDAMETVLHCREDVKGCSRTDAGVHANRFCMNFHTDHPIPLYALKRSLNALLPDDIGDVGLPGGAGGFPCPVQLRGQTVSVSDLECRWKKSILPGPCAGILAAVGVGKIAAGVRTAARHT